MGAKAMTFNEIIGDSVVAFVVLMVVTPLAFRAIGIKGFAWSFAAVYLLFSIAFHSIFWTTYKAPQGAIAALIPLGLAVPGSLLGVVGASQAAIPLSVLGGSLQYFGIGWLVDRHIRRRQQCQPSPPSDVATRAAHED